MSRMRQGWQLTKKSWALLRANKQLFKFPLIGAVATLVVTLGLVGPGFYLFDDGREVLGGALLAVGLFLSAFIATYFGVALASTADAIFHGRDATFSDGMAAARSHVGAIAGWALLSAIVGAIFAAIRQGGSIGEAIIGSLGAAAWSLITFLAVPVIAIEGLGPIATVKRSASLFRERWAGQVTGNIAIGGIVGLLGVLPAVLMVIGGGYLWINDDGGAGLAAGALIALAGIALFAVSTLIISAMRGVFGVALYRFASDGEVASGFTQADLESAVRTKGGAPAPAAA